MAIKLSDLSARAQKLVKKPSVVKPRVKKSSPPFLPNQADLTCRIMRDEYGRQCVLPKGRKTPAVPFGYTFGDGEGSNLEADFLLKLRAARAEIFDGRFGPLLREWAFAHPTRRWRFDFAFPTLRVAIEVEGGVHSGGRHVTGAGYESDLDKYNEAASRGWTLFRVSGKIIGKGMNEFAKSLRDALEWRAQSPEEKN